MQPLQLTIFKALGNFWSLERYAEEIAPAFESAFRVQKVSAPLRPGLAGKIFDKYWRYLRYARKMQGDRNLIISEGYSFLLLALDPALTVCICHGVQSLLYPGRDLRYRTLLRMNLRLMGRAKHVIAVSEQTRNELLKLCPFLRPEKVTAVHNGLHQRWRPISDADALQRYRQKSGLGRRIILHVGNDNLYKNFAALLRAFALLRHDDKQLVKAGAISEKSLALARELRVEEKLRVLPNISSEELVMLYNCSSVLVFPSLHESFGWPPLEAMACGCPVVASNRGSLPEICGDACLFVDPEDDQSIAAAITRTLEDSALRQSLVQKGFAQARKYDWNMTAAAITKLL